MGFFGPRKDAADGDGRGQCRRRRYRGGRDQPLTIADLDDGGRFRIVAVEAVGEIRRRLMDMGFVRGSTGMVLREALLRDPIELEMMGYKISLRRAEAREIIIEELD
jgi:Fe2+ transport system protein FeoA